MRRPRVLFFVQNLSTNLRFIDPVVRLELECGHEVELVTEVGDDPDPTGEGWLRELEAQPRFRWTVTDAWRRDPWFPVARRIRLAADYVRFLHPIYERTPYLARRAEARAPRLVRLVARSRLCRSRKGLRRLSGLLESLDSAVPVSRRLKELVRERSPDVVLLFGHLMPGSTGSGYLLAAQALGARTCFCVASWDNLSSKQRLRVLPDAVTVWNETQKREAVELHGIPPERVVVTGAQCFDHWFGWQARDRGEFCRRVGLDPGRPYLLYLAGALFPAGLTEAEFARRWIGEVRAGADPVLRDAGILVRPHPQRADEWEPVRFDDLPGVAVWPRGNRAMPLEAEARQDYFDSLHHSAAVIGVNTSAMIEAAIVGRPVYCLHVPEFATSQGGTFHFRYLSEVGGGFLHEAWSLDEHRAQLAEALRSPEAHHDEGRSFVEEFVRPHGLDVSATAVFVDAIERLARLDRTAPPRPRAGAVLLRPLLAVGLVPRLARRSLQKVRLELGRAATRTAR